MSYLSNLQVHLAFVFINACVSIKQKKKNMWKKIRVLILLLILATVIQNQWLDKNDKKWEKSLYVALYPINADNSAVADRTIQALNQEDFLASRDYLEKQATNYGLTLYHPFELRLAQAVSTLPPLPPKPSSIINTISWSLQFRWWAWRNSPSLLKTGEKMVKPGIKLYLLYYDPKTHPILSHSTALNKGRIGLVNLFASHDHQATNLVIMTHELLHTMDATDKYNLADNMPAFPDGYAEPEKLPLFPQLTAELMGGRIPISASKAEIPKNLGYTMIGVKTATEIGWLKSASAH